MNKRFITLCPVLAVALCLTTGCKTKTIVYDPAETSTNLRQEGTVSSEEMQTFVKSAINNAMSSPRFTAFLSEYKQEKQDTNAVPILKLDRVLNQTDDPDLHVDEITDMLKEALIEAGRVDVTMAEGQGKTQEIAASRDLKNDANFDQSTVAATETLQAARLVLRPKVISNKITDGDQKAVTRTFVMEMADVKKGIIIWTYTKQVAFKKEKGWFGW